MSSTFLPLPVCAAAEGWLQRVVILGSDTHVIEEIQLFDSARPVDSLTISHSKVRKPAYDLSETPHVDAQRSKLTAVHGKIIYPPCQL